MPVVIARRSPPFETRIAPILRWALARGHLRGQVQPSVASIVEEGGATTRSHPGGFDAARAWTTPSIPLLLMNSILTAALWLAPFLCFEAPSAMDSATGEVTVGAPGRATSNRQPSWPGSVGQARSVGTLESLLAPRPKIVASAEATPPEFGAAVALDPGGPGRAPLAFVGAPLARVDGGTRGAVQIFRAPGGGLGHWLDGWGHLLEGHGLAVGARFGASLAASGGVFAVGAPGAGGERSGLVRIYSAPGAGPGVVHRPRLLAELAPPPGSTGAAFGETLAIESTASGQIHRLAVGAPHATGGGPGAVALAGRVFVYRRDPGGTFSLDFAACAPEPRAVATFGAAMAFSGGYLLVGAPGDGLAAPGAGRVVAFGPDGRPMFEIAPPEDSATGAAGARFGAALCSMGAKGFAVSSFGRGLVEVFRLPSAGSPGSHPIHEQTVRGVTSHRFGTSIATCGGLLLVGAPGFPGLSGAGQSAPGVGQVRVFARLDGVWSAVGALRSAMPSRNGEFGLSLASAHPFSLVGEPGSSGACPKGAECLAGLAAAFRMPR